MLHNGRYTDSLKQFIRIFIPVSSSTLRLRWGYRFHIRWFRHWTSLKNLQKNQKRNFGSWPHWNGLSSGSVSNLRTNSSNSINVDRRNRQLRPCLGWSIFCFVCSRCNISSIRVDSSILNDQKMVVWFLSQWLRIA